MHGGVLASRIGAADFQVGTHGTRGTVSGTRTPGAVSLHQVTKDLDAKTHDYVVDYAVDETGLTLRPGDPAAPVLVRTCTFGEL